LKEKKYDLAPNFVKKSKLIVELYNLISNWSSKKYNLVRNWSFLKIKLS